MKGAIIIVRQHEQIKIQMEEQRSLTLSTMKKTSKSRLEINENRPNVGGNVTPIPVTVAGKGKENKCKNEYEKWHMKIDCPTE